MPYYKRSKYETELNGPCIESRLSPTYNLCRMHMLISSGKFSLEEYKLIFSTYPLYVEMWFKEDSETIREEILTRKIWYF